MKVTKGQLVKVNSRKHGQFTAKAVKEFDTAHSMIYPVHQGEFEEGGGIITGRAFALAWDDAEVVAIPESKKK